MKKQLSIIMIAVAATTLFSMTVNLQSNTLTFDAEDINIQEAFAADPNTCSQRVAEIINEKTFGYTLPKILPEGYDARDGYSDQGQVGLLYAPGDTCGPNAQFKSLQDGIVQYYVANKSIRPEKISNPEFYFNEYKTNSDYPERITITEIAGNISMVWDSGMEKNIFIDSDGNVFAEEEVSYPAQITMVDKEDEKLYVVKGYVALEDLEKMIKSALP